MALVLPDSFNLPNKSALKNTLSFEQLAFAVCRGGWPKAILKKTENAALIQVEEYVEAITRSDISRADNVNRNPERAKRLMRCYARHQGTQASIATILADLSVNETDRLSEATIDSYLTALRKLFVIEDMPAWNPDLRSKTAIRSSDTRYFTDPSIATAALEEWLVWAH